MGSTMLQVPIPVELKDQLKQLAWRRRIPLRECVQQILARAVLDALGESPSLSPVSAGQVP